MKRQIFFILSLVLCVLTASATPVSKSKAQAIATSFFQRGAKTTRATGVAARFCKEYASRKDAPAALYAFSSGESVVFVSAEDEMPAILGYSERADLDNLPPAMEWLLNSYALLTDAVRNGEIEAPKLYASADAVEPLCKTIWDQTEPFRSLCPLSEGKPVANGCLSTAFAQVMKYYEWPKKGEGKTRGYISNLKDSIPSMDLSTHVYNWDDILDDYTGTYTKEQGQAVAQLCYDMAVASRMNFADAGSGTQIVEGAYALRNHFGYSKDLYIDYASYFSEEEWVAKLKNELRQKRPLPYGGTDKHSNEGHCFVIDGYNAEGLFHVNWGWSGEDNDYFLITSLKPNNKGIGGGSKENDFSSDQQTIFNCVPDYEGTSQATEEHFRFSYTQCEGVGKDSIKIYSVKNLSAGDFRGALILQLVDKEGKVAEQKEIIHDYSLVSGRREPVLEVSLKVFDFSHFANGTYHTEMIAVSSATNIEYPLLHLAHDCSIVVEDGKLKGVFNSDAILEGTIVSCDFISKDDALGFIKVKVKAQAKNISDVAYGDNIDVAASVYYNYDKDNCIGMSDNSIVYRKEINPGETAELEGELNIDSFLDDYDQQLLIVEMRYANGLIDTKEYPMNDLITTALNDAKADKELNSAPAYNTMGQRVNPKTAKGIIIQNGKKTLGL